jgi:hypothetical protein
LKHGLIVVCFIAAAFVAAPAISQGSRADVALAKPEITTKVLDVRGKPVAPWIESQKCIVATKVCKTTLFNPETGEVARFGDQWVETYKKNEGSLEVTRTGPPISRGKSSKAPIPEE